MSLACLAAVIGTCVSGIGGVVASVLRQPPTVPIPTIWQHWVISNTIGFIAVAPLLIGLAAALRQRRPRTTELVEGIAARCRAVFAAAGAFIVSITIVYTTVFSIGHFGDPSIEIADRILGAQAAILVVALSAYVLAALFAERRESEARLASSNMMLERERSNKLMNLEAMTASISHEVRQPLTAIVGSSSALLRFLGSSPPRLDKAHSAAEVIIAAGHRASQMLDDIRNLFGTTQRVQSPVDVNELAMSALRVLDGELKSHKITTRVDLQAKLPSVMGHSGQLQEVIVNLIQNAIEAMDTVENDRRVLQLR